MDHSNIPNGHGPQTNGLPQQPAMDSRRRSLRIPTVNAALPFSPFSSVMPFNADLITPPLALPSTAPTAFDNFNDVKTARRELERLATGAKSAETSSKRCQQTLNDVQRLLKADSLTQFKFKTTKRAHPDVGPAIFKEVALSPFAEMVLSGTEVQYKYVQPESASQSHEENPTSNGKLATPLQQTKQVTRPTPRQHSQQPHSHPNSDVLANSYKPKFSKVQVQKPAPILIPRGSQLTNGHIQTPQETPSPSQTTAPSLSTPGTAYVKLGALTPAQLSEYKMFSEATQAANDLTPSRKKSPSLTKRNTEDRDQATETVGVLRSLLRNIFEAEERLPSDSSGAVPTHANTLFSLLDSDTGPVPVLHTDSQLKLEKAIQKVVACRRLDDIEVEDLVRVQRLCETTLLATESESLHIGDEWAEQDISEWLGRIASAQNGQVAACTMMRIMTGGSHHKELQSEDFLAMIIDSIRAVVDRCIIPAIEERSFVGDKVKGEKSLQRSAKFDIAVSNRKSLQSLVQSTKKCLKLLGDLLIATNFDETRISSVEYLCKSLIFAENASVDKEAALGTVTFERLRVTAMDVLGRIFTKYTDQRNFIFTEILYSLEKLPAKKQSARQFSLRDGKPIQLVSALLMRLVQTSATLTAGAKSNRNDGAEEESHSDESDESEESEDEEYDSDTIHLTTPKQKKHKQHHSRNAQPRVNGNDLVSLYKPLLTDAQSHASYIIRLLVNRALTSSKSSEEPFRRLLDLFTEDFLNVLGHSDWPAAELFLRTLAMHMISIAKNAKTPAPSRTLSLELLGTIGSGILDIRAGAVLAINSLDTTRDSFISEYLAFMGKEIANGTLNPSTLTAVDGPYPVVIQYLNGLELNGDLHLQTARGYHLVQWADLVCGPSKDQDPQVTSHASTRLQSIIKQMIEDEHSLIEGVEVPEPNTAEGKAAAKIVASESMLCKLFTQISTVILQSMGSDQPTVRSRSIKSITTLLEKDPAMLDRNHQILVQIFRTLSDSSPLVRDSALVLLQKCVSLRPTLELKIYDRVVPRTHDTSIAVRKRAMAFLKQIYLHNEDNRVRAVISNALIPRVKDNDEGVADAARASIEEVWFTALREPAADGERKVETGLRLHSHAALVIQTVELGDNVAAVLEALIKMLLTQSKQAVENVGICKSLVAAFFEGIINNTAIPGEPSQSAILRTMTVFAKAAPKLFTAAQLEHLEPYVQNLANSDDLDIYHHTVTILRYTMPVIGTIRQEFSKNLQNALVGTIAKLPKSELAVVAPCLWTIDSVLGGTTRLQKLVLSALRGIYEMRAKDLGDPGLTNKVSRLLAIVGQFGKACNFDQHLNVFKAHFPWYKGKDVAGLLVEVACQFTSPKQPLDVRMAALAAVCEICASFPDHFMRADAVNAIETVFKEKNSELEDVLLTNFSEFFNIEVTSAEEQEILGTGVETGTQRLGGTYQATGYDTASTSLSQRFLQDFLRIALSSMNEVALAAARVVVHINTRGMAHPSASGPSLVALETCPNTAIAKLAFLSHKEQFTKHENVYEKGLGKAVQEAFDYQRRVVQDTAGTTGHPPTSKLHFFWEVLRNGKLRVRHKLLTNVCSSLDFDPAKLKFVGDPPQRLLYARFCVESIALLDFSLVDEPLHFQSCLEKVVAGTGITVAQAIESDILQLQVPIASSQQQVADTSAIALVNAIDGPGFTPATPAIDPNRLRHLAICAQILTLLSETRSFIRRLYNLQKVAGKPKKSKKDAEKDSEKKATRATNAAALTDAYQTRIGNIMGMPDSEYAQRKMCTDFVELSNVDTEVKVGSDNDDDMDLDLEDGDDARSEGSSARSPSAGSTPRGKKRKSIDGGAGAPAKKRVRSGKKFKQREEGEEDSEGGWV